MDVKGALKEQYHGALAMLHQCVERCPDDLWIAGEHPRPYWRIAFHCTYFTHLHFGIGRSTFPQWPARRLDYYPELWQGPYPLEPYEIPEDAPVLDKSEMLDYVNFVDSLVDPAVDATDFDTPKGAADPYPEVSKMSHELMNLRHVQGHMGQLSELLMMRGIDIEWVEKA